jgi:hypothetical protein
VSIEHDPASKQYHIFVHSYPYQSDQAKVNLDLLDPTLRVLGNPRDYEYWSVPSAIVGKCNVAATSQDTYLTVNGTFKLNVIIRILGYDHKMITHISETELKALNNGCFGSFMDQEVGPVAVVSSEVDEALMKSPAYLVKTAARVDVALILLATMAIDARYASSSCACL